VAERLVFPRDGVVGELRGQPVMRAVGFRHHQQPRGVLVDAVHDAGAFLAADAREVAAEMMQERVDQRARGRPRRGMDDHARGLVDDHEVGILVQDLQRDRFGHGVDLRRLLHGDGDGVALDRCRAGVRDDRAVHSHRPLGDQPGKARAAQRRLLWHVAAQCLIKARRRVGTDPELDEACARHGR
jgi:hypothetical protein